MASNGRPNSASGSWRRRAVVLVVLASPVVAFQLGLRLRDLLGPEITFVELERPAGFRRMVASELGETSNPFIGLKWPGEDTQVRFPPPGNICEALFGGPVQQGIVPIASFSDYYCPYCRVLTEKLAEIESEANGKVRIRWHELPLLGAASRDAARAALAADMQGAYAQFHRRLMRARFAATPSFLEAVARDIGLDPERLMSDMKSEDVERRLETTMALADLFGFIGTPALVIGRTVVVGSISKSQLEALVEIERRDWQCPEDLV